MRKVKGLVRDGAIVLDEQTALPEGAEVQIIFEREPEELLPGPSDSALRAARDVHAYLRQKIAENAARESDTAQDEKSGIHPAIMKVWGIVENDVDAREIYRAHLERKYLR